MRFQFERGAWGLSVYPWHSVNLVPHASVTPICTDDPPHEVFSRALWLTVFGTVVVVQWPSRRRTGGEILRGRGPCYSRRRRVWYSIAQLDEEHA